ncbi:MAG: hypothetical protein ACRDDA_04285 [Aeromonas sp.]
MAEAQSNQHGLDKDIEMEQADIVVNSSALRKSLILSKEWLIKVLTLPGKLNSNLTGCRKKGARKIQILSCVCLFLD